MIHFPSTKGSPEPEVLLAAITCTNQLLAQLLERLGASQTGEQPAWPMIVPPGQIEHGVLEPDTASTSPTVATLAPTNAHKVSQVVDPQQAEPKALLFKPPIRVPLPPEGLVRLKSILAPIGPIEISRSSWWQGVRDGKFPKPVKLGPNTSCWRVEEIRALIANPEAWERNHG